MSSTAAAPGSPGGLPCPCNGSVISPYAHRGEILWYCRFVCDRYGGQTNPGLCWGVNHPAHCGTIYEKIGAMNCFPKKTGSPAQQD